MANFLGTPKFQAFDSNGDPLSGGKLYTYISGTTTAKATYPTLMDAEAGTNANANPVILDSRGEATVVLTGSYKLILKTSADSQLWSVDAVGTTSNTLLNDAYGNDVIVLAAGGSNAVNYLTVTNATTGTSPIVSASGSDTNVDLKVTSKGSGTLKLDAGATGTVDIGTVSTGVINLKRNTAVTGTLSTSGTATLNAASISTTLGVTGTSTMAAVNATTLSSSGASTLNSLGVTGAATVGTTLGVTGASTLASVGVTGAATVGTTLAVTGNTTLSTMNTFTYPSSDGSAGQFLKTNGSKVLAFASSPLLAATGNLAFRATSNNETITHHASVAQKLLFSTETFDTGSCFASSRFTPTVNGYYHIHSQVAPNAIDVGAVFYLLVYKNGSLYCRDANTKAFASGDDARRRISTTMLLNGSTDYVEIYAICNNAADTVTLATATDSWFEGFLVQAI